MTTNLQTATDALVARGFEITRSTAEVVRLRKGKTHVQLRTEGDPNGVWMDVEVEAPNSYAITGTANADGSMVALLIAAL